MKKTNQLKQFIETYLIFIILMTVAALFAFVLVRMLDFLPFAQAIFTILLIPVMYVALGLLLLVLLGVFSGAVNVIREVHLQIRMRKVGRYKNWRQIAQDIKDHPGTILVDYPTIGWGVTRAWWTKDDVMSIAPYPPPKSLHEIYAANAAPASFETWCHALYTHPETGSAILFGIWNGKRRASLLCQHLDSKATMINVYSGSLDPMLRLHHDSQADRQSGQGAWNNE